MSNHNSNSNGDRTFLVTSIKGFEDASGKGLPLGHAYLIRSSVTMPELYPLLGELIFGSHPSSPEADVKTKNVESEGASGLNVIGMFVDDHRDTLFMNLDIKLKKEDLENVTDEFLVQYKEGRPLPITAVWMDTFGKFGDEFESIEFDKDKKLSITLSKKKKKLIKALDWKSHSILGAGNPMSMFRFVSQALKCPAKDDKNLYVLNSLSNLYRNLGLSETSAFLKELLNKCIWSVEEQDETLIGAKTGIFFAVLQKGVMRDSEERYLSSFFDGIIDVTIEKKENELDKNSFRIPAIKVESLPETIKLPETLWYVPLWYNEEVGADLEEVKGKPFFIKIYRKK